MHMDIYPLHTNIMAIHAEIKAGQPDIKMELNRLCETVKRDMKEEFKIFQEEINQNLSKLWVDLKSTEARMKCRNEWPSGMLMQKKCLSKFYSNKNTLNPS